MKNWIVALYKRNKEKDIKLNLRNQNFKFYIPKILRKKINSSIVEELMFPGYLFIEADLEYYSALRYTSGIKNIISFGNHIACLKDEDIFSIRAIEKFSYLDPVNLNFKVGHEARIQEGSFAGNIVKISSLPAKGRLDVLLYVLGSVRSINISEKYLT